MESTCPKSGWVYLVGAGPGDPGLVTVRALALLQGADVVVYDRLVAEELLGETRADATRCYVGKRDGKHTLPQGTINELLVTHARSGASVVRLKGGDPFVFGRGGEEALALAEAGIPFEIVPGVTAAIAAAAYAGIPLTHRKLASSACLVTGHECPDKAGSGLDYEALADQQGTLAFYMGVSNMERICANLIRHGRHPETPAAVIQWGTTARQQVVSGTVEALPKLSREAGLRPPAMIIVGRVVALRERLNWFSYHSSLVEGS